MSAEITQEEQANKITESDIIEALPKTLRRSIPKGLLDSINAISESDGYMRANYKDNVLGFTSVLKEGKFKLTEYLNAVRFASYRLMGLGVSESYNKTFPDRYKRLLDEGATPKYMSSFSSAYNKTKIVSAIMEQTLIPTHILNADIYQEAINVQANLMKNAKSEKVRSDAANSLMIQLRQPEVNKVSLDIGYKDDNIISELKDITQKLAATQLKGIEEGTMNVIDIAKSEIVTKHEEDSGAN